MDKESIISKADELLNELDANEAEQQMYRMKWLDENYHKYQAVLDKAVKFHLQKLIKAADEQIPQLEEQYSEMTKKGIPFLERKKIGDKLERVHTAREIFLEEIKNLQTKDLREWLDYNDIKEIEAHGFLNTIGHPVVLNRAYETN